MAKAVAAVTKAVERVKVVVRVESVERVKAVKRVMVAVMKLAAATAKGEGGGRWGGKMTLTEIPAISSAVMLETTTAMTTATNNQITATNKLT